MRFKRKIILTIIFTITIMLVIGFSYAKFVKRDIEGGDNYNVVIGNTISASEMSPNFTVTYDEGDNIINTEEIIPNYQQLIKFKVSTNFNNIQYITISLDSMINTSSGTYALYSCNETNYNNATYANVSSNCTLISTTSDTLPLAGEKKLAHSNNKLTLNGDSTNYYALTINTLTANNTFKGFISVKNLPTLIKKIFAAYTPVFDDTSSTYVSSGSGINFSAINSPTNGQGLYINSKSNIVSDPTVGTIKYFRGGTYCYLSGSAITDSTTCTNAGGTWSDYHCSLSDSQSACTTAGGTYYELKNNVMFAGYAWKILKINSDESIRLVYNGNSPTVRGASSISTTNGYGTGWNSAIYVGYSYNDSSVTTNDGTASNMKTILNTWYNSNLSLYNDKIAQEEKYCNDTTSTTCTINDHINSTCFGAYPRTNTGHTPTYSCPVTDKTYGGEYIQNIGAISIDEAVYAGAVYATTNYTFFLQIGTDYWTMTPDCVDNGIAYVWYIGNNGAPYGRYPSYSFGIRPVIDIKKNIEVESGNGTLSDPWVIAS